MDNHIAVAKHETLVEVLCPLSTGRVKRSASSKDEENFSTAFEISVSYDGVLFSEPVDMLIYDSRCQEVVNTTERIHLRLMVSINNKYYNTNQLLFFLKRLLCHSLFFFFYY